MINDDDDDDDFEFNEEYSEEDMEEARKQAEAEDLETSKHPLFQQSKEVLNILDVICAVSGEDETYSAFLDTLRHAAEDMHVKVSATLMANTYVLCMQNAAIIRDNAQYLRLANHTLSAFEDLDPKYIEMFRSEMEKFRMLFRKWALEIRDMDNEFEDEWGLFVK
ncbi:MAG: hypothetical protein PSX36_11500 [bacterium]|nr:hypothetical protein [bacterium]